MTDSETVIERLLGLLDELGVEHEDYSYILPSTQEEYEFTNVLDSDGRTMAQFTTCSDPRKVDAYAKLTPEQAIVATLGAEQPPVDKLIRCLENDYGITASWDGLRKVWLTERATLGAGGCAECAIKMGERADSLCDPLKERVAELEAALNEAAGKWARADAELHANDGTRWQELFGTPEKAARTLIAIPCGNEPCCSCPVFNACCSDDVPDYETADEQHDLLLGWLRGEEGR